MNVNNFISKASRDALLEEVNYLCAKNAKLAEDVASVPLLKEESRSGREQIEVLLVLLGEKDEELEAILSDLKDVKNLYKDQMEKLLDEVIKGNVDKSIKFENNALD